MNAGKLARYKVYIRTLTPLAIGNGVKRSKSEYIANGNVWLVPSMPRLLALLSQKCLLQSFESYLSDPVLSRTQGLGSWLRNNGVEVSRQAVWVEYAIPAQRLENSNDLSQCIKTCDGRPYIPGSSIKGVLRTQFISNKMNQVIARLLLDNVADNPKYKYSGPEEQMLKTLHLTKKGDDTVNDILKALEISDSAPFDSKQLCVCRTVDLMRDVRGGEKRNLLPLYRECIRAGAESWFYVTVDTSLYPEFTVRRLMEIASGAYQAQMDYISGFSFGNFVLPALPQGEAGLVLGVGTGFQSKSLVYRAATLDGKDYRPIAHKILAAQFPKRHNGRGYYKPPQGNASPAPYCLKLAQCDGSLYPFGLCALRAEA